MFVPTPLPLLQLAAKAPTSSTNASTKRARTVPDQSLQNKLLPVPIQVIQRLLVLAGDTVSILGAVQYLPEEQQWQIQGDQRGKGRKCLLKSGTTHASNNALLFIDRFDAGFPQMESTHSHTY